MVSRATGNCLGRSFPLIQRPKGHIFQDGGAEELIVGILKEQAHLLPDIKKILLFFDFLPQDDYSSRLGPQQSHNQMQQGGLAAAVGTDQAQMFAGQKLKIKILKNRLGGSGVGIADVV